MFITVGDRIDHFLGDVTTMTWVSYIGRGGGGSLGFPLQAKSPPPLPSPPPMRIFEVGIVSSLLAAILACLWPEKQPQGTLILQGAYPHIGQIFFLHL